MRPATSVIVTTYNHERLIGATIESVLAQTYRDYELIVVDDGSTDGTPDAVAPYRDRLSFIRQENQGPAASRNRGIEAARGRFLAFLDGDDLWEPDKLAYQVAAAEANPNSGIVAVDGVQFSDGGILRDSLFGDPIAQLLDGRESVTAYCYPQMLQHNVIPTTSQVLIPRRVLDEVGLSDTSLLLSSDWDLYIRIAISRELTFVGRKLTRWRYLESSASGPEWSRSLRWAPDDIEILRKHLRVVPEDQRRLVRVRLREKTLNTAKAAYWHGLARDPRWTRRYLFDLFRRNATSAVLACYVVGAYLPWLRPIGRHLRRLLEGRVE